MVLFYLFREFRIIKPPKLLGWFIYLHEMITKVPGIIYEAKGIGYQYYSRLPVNHAGHGMGIT